MSAVVSGSIGIFVPFFIFVLVLFMYLHTIWLKNAFNDHGYGGKGVDVYPQKTVEDGISEFLGVVGGVDASKDGHGWQSNDTQYGRQSAGIRENPYKNNRIPGSPWVDNAPTSFRNTV
jgi:hypothetical protein